MISRNAAVCAAPWAFCVALSIMELSLGSKSLAGFQAAPLASPDWMKSQGWPDCSSNHDIAYVLEMRAGTVPGV
ncbi:hypothetical protein [Streptomyces melanosporofaciens]|uniref:hypothetical protein n=1 Tax=Streptomyces melanosporofaciens TaxID=67327 RepID=UPI000B80C1AA|nr:hypothetical protein [Streptomyces melanosporofaciens]